MKRFYICKSFVEEREAVSSAFEPDTVGGEVIGRADVLLSMIKQREVDGVRTKILEDSQQVLSITNQVPHSLTLPYPEYEEWSEVQSMSETTESEVCRSDLSSRTSVEDFVVIPPPSPSSSSETPRSQSSAMHAAAPRAGCGNVIFSVLAIMAVQVAHDAGAGRQGGSCMP